jgi:hypothetical protein
VHKTDAVVPEIAVHPNSIPKVSPNMGTMKGDHISRLQFARVNGFEARRILNNYGIPITTVAPKLGSMARWMMFSDADILRAIQSLVRGTLKQAQRLDIVTRSGSRGQ